MAADRERRLTRWSRLKRRDHDVKIAPPDAAALPAETKGRTAAPTTPPPDADPPTPIDAGAVEPPSLGEIDLPSIESLTADSDYAPFLRDGVPQHLARAAMRKLWLSDPVLANLDGLNDYDEDYSIITPIASALKAGSLTQQDSAKDSGAEAREEEASSPGVAADDDDDDDDEGAAIPEEETEPEGTENEPIDDDDGKGVPS